jgi:hypothetical protein
VGGLIEFLMVFLKITFGVFAKMKLLAVLAEAFYMWYPPLSYV